MWAALPIVAGLEAAPQNATIRRNFPVLPWKLRVFGLQGSDFGLSGYFGGEADSWSFLL